ncbi:MAG: CoA transferase [Pseudomonadota bacterium]
MAGPLSGIRILDATAMIAGPLATALLGDQGAEILKLEPPGGGDHTRQVAGRRNGVAAAFLHNNRSKRSIALNLKDPEGVEAALRLAETADVFVQNWRPGVAERLGLGEAAVRARRPDIVYVSIAGFGFDGPWARRPVYDPLIQALSGLASVQGAGGRPRLVRTILPDKATALTASQAITAALLARARTGRGDHVRLSMLDAISHFLWASDMTGLTFPDAPPREPQAEAKAQSFVELIYETQDGHMAVSAHTDVTWKGLSRAVNRPDWLDDPRFATVEAREVNKAARLEITQEALLGDTTERWMARLEAEDVPCAPVLSRSQTLTHPQIEANGTVLEREHPQAGRYRQARAPAVFDVHAAEPPGHARALGADTEAALAEAGYAPDEIARLFETGAAAAPPPAQEAAE